MFNTTSFDALADSLVAAGVTRIDGDVLGDGTRYDDEFFAPGWGAGVAGLEGGPYDALMANDARVLGDELRVGRPEPRPRRVSSCACSPSGASPCPVGQVSARRRPAPTELASIQSLPLTDVVHEMLDQQRQQHGRADGQGDRAVGVRRRNARGRRWRR